jgi:hypothetical protein
MKEIPLTKGKVALVDDSDFEWLMQWKWYYLDDRNGYALRSFKRSLVWMHRVIMNAPKDMQVDHINCNSIDNRRCNLRLCSQSENQRNRGATKKSVNGYKGLHWHRGKWQVQITVNGQSTHLGTFTDEIEAAKAYDKAARELHGEFARLNFPAERS